MEEKYSRKEIMEKDILDLLERIVEERKHFNPKHEKFMGGLGTITYEAEGFSNKDYSVYRKLIDSLSKLISTYTRMVQDSNKKEVNIFKYLVNGLNNEINECHSLMSDALKRSSDEQYRCLNDTYIKLISMVSNIERSLPKESEVEVFLKKFMDADISDLLPNLTSIKFPQLATGTQKCTGCKHTKSINEFYTVNDKKLTMCKSCLKEYVAISDFNLIDFLSKNDIVFLKSLWVKSDKNIALYLKTLCLDPYRGLIFKQSKFVD